MKTLPHEHIYDDFDDMNKAFLKLQRTLGELQDLSCKVSVNDLRKDTKQPQEPTTAVAKSKWERTKNFLCGKGSR